MSTTTKARERPIVFGGPEVKAILAGCKSTFRRPIKPQPEGHFAFMPLSTELVGCGKVEKGWQRCPFGVPGDLLYVKETFAFYPDADHVIYREREGADLAADGVDLTGCWTPAICMPRWASRLTLRVESVRVEKLQEISYRDCLSEGIPPVPCYDDGAEPETILAAIRSDFARLWDSINAGRGFSWESNCWGWVVAFAVVKGGES